MYHEEKIIDGILHWRSTPDGQWYPYSAVELTAKIRQWKEAAEEWNCGCPEQLKQRIFQLPETY